MSPTPGFLTRTRLKLLESRTPFKPPEIRALNAGFFVLRQPPIKDQTHLLSESMLSGRSAAVKSVFDIGAQNCDTIDVTDVALTISPALASPHIQRQSSAARSSSAICSSPSMMSTVAGEAAPPPSSFLQDDTQQHAVLVEIAVPQIFSDSLALQTPHIEGKVYAESTDAQDKPTPLETSHASGRINHNHVAHKADSSGPSPLSDVFEDLFEDLYLVLLPPKESLLRVPLLFREGQSCFPFQWDGVKFLLEHEQGLLADEMGLGKSIQAIVALRILFRLGRVKNALIVSPKSVLSDWEDKLITWAPELRTKKVQGSEDTRKRLWRASAHVFVTNYETLKIDLKGKRVEPNFDIVVLDEIQRIKNPDTGITKAARSLHAPFRWGLSGTPLENKVDDIISVFSFIKPGLLRPDDAGRPQYVRSAIRPLMLRRRKVDALKLPEKIVDEVWLELTPRQRVAYQKAEKEGVIELNKFGDTVTVTHVLALITKLKQICNVDLGSGQSCKVDYLKDQLAQAASQDDKALVFSQYPEKTLAVIGPMLQEFHPTYYTGALSERKRAKMVREFQNGDQCNVLLMSLKAGGLGLTLTRAHYVFHFDLWWNPATASQAEDRAHRIGQTSTVFVTYLYSRNTIEERIHHMLKTKRALFNQVVDDLSDSHLEKAITREELFALFNLNVQPKQDS